jgi:hypothetical protein
MKLIEAVRLRRSLLPPSPPNVIDQITAECGYRSFRRAFIPTPARARRQRPDHFPVRVHEARRQREPVRLRRRDRDFERDVGLVAAGGQTEPAAGLQARRELSADLPAQRLSAADFEVELSGFEQADGFGAFAAGESFRRVNAGARADVERDYFIRGGRRRDGRARIGRSWRARLQSRGRRGRDARRDGRRRRRVAYQSAAGRSRFDEEQVTQRRAERG